MPACQISIGRKLPCKDQLGGIKRVFIADQFTTLIATVAAGTGLTTLTTAQGVTLNLYQFDVKSASGLEQTITSSSDNGTTFFSATLTLVLQKLDALTSQLLNDLVKGRSQCFVEDFNGNYLSVGLTRGCDFNGSATTGVALGDLTGFTLTITAEEPLMCSFITSASITSRIQASAGAPTQINP